MTDPPEPTGVPTDIVDRLAESSPEELRHIATYARELAAHREREGDEESTGDVEDAPAEADDDRPEGVPGRASVTVKEINDNRYYYWQWRDGDYIRSKYKGPVNGGE